MKISGESFRCSKKARLDSILTNRLGKIKSTVEIYSNIQKKMSLKLENNCDASNKTKFSDIPDVENKQAKTASNLNVSKLKISKKAYYVYYIG